MSHPNPLSGGVLASSPLRKLLVLGAFTACLTHLDAIEVDSEMVLLVDVSRPGLSDVQFQDLMDSYASAFTSSEVLDSIQSGNRGQIAVSMMLFGNRTTQAVGVPWMLIGSQGDADAFASLASNVTRPFSVGFSNTAGGLNAATDYFGTETGGSDNGFESSVQIIEVAASGIPFIINSAETSQASDDALGAGVDLVNSTGIGPFGGISEAYYEQNVIGSTIDGVDPSHGTSPNGADLAENIQTTVTNSFDTGAEVSILAVPEPRTSLFLASALGLLMTRRARGA